jgi:putative addiction module component (TIGR02574 family)
MAMAPRQIVEAALGLCRDERIELAEKLIASVHDSPDPEWEQAWATELERCTAEYERTGEAYSIDEAFDRAMARVSGQ